MNLIAPLPTMHSHLDVLEVHITILTKIHNRSQEVKQTFEALEGLKQINEALCGELLMVLGGNLHADLEILTDVSLHHGF